MSTETNPPGNTPPPFPPPPAPPTGAVPPIFAAPDPNRHQLGDFPVAALVILHFVTCGLFTFIWLNLQHGKMPKVRPNDPSAARAVGFCFIPFFNFYWIFVTYRRLCLRVDEQREAYGLPPSDLKGLATACCIVQLIPYVGLLGWLILWPIFAGMMQASINELVRVSAGKNPQRPLAPLAPPGGSSAGVIVLVVALCFIPIIAILAAMLLPALAQAKAKAYQTQCLGNQRQLAIAAHLYSVDYSDWLPPMQVELNGGRPTWRAYLFSYVSKNARVFDCPADHTNVYALGSRGAPLRPNPAVIGLLAEGENELCSGQGAVNVHWISGGAQPPFGRPSPDENNLCRWSAIQKPVQCILFGDGNSDFDLLWPNDHWWIWKEQGDANAKGFNRAVVNDPGAFRHRRRSNYAFADGRATALDPGRIPCDTRNCWWSATASPHSTP